MTYFTGRRAALWASLPIMTLTSPSETAREYRVQATTARTLADAATDPSVKKLYLDFERYWLDRALDYASAECLLFTQASTTHPTGSDANRPVNQAGHLYFPMS